MWWFLELHDAVPLHFQHHVPNRWVNNCASLAEMNVLLQNSYGSFYGPMSSKLARVSLLCHLKTTRTNSKTTSFPIVQQHLHLSDLSCLCGSSTSLSLQRCWPKILLEIQLCLDFLYWIQGTGVISHHKSRTLQVDFQILWQRRTSQIWKKYSWVSE